MRDDDPESRESDAAERDCRVDLSTDDVHLVLASTCRRRLLTLLVDDPSRSRDELATLLAGWEATANRPMATPKDRARLEAALHHHHLPRLDEVGALSYDPTTGRVVLADLADETQAVIERAETLPSARE